MIRKILKPQKNRVIIDIPNEYIEKDIEILVFPIEKNREYIADKSVEFSVIEDVTPQETQENFLKLDDNQKSLDGLSKMEIQPQQEISFNANEIEDRFFEPNLDDVKNSDLDEFISLNNEDVKQEEDNQKAETIEPIKLSQEVEGEPKDMVSFDLKLDDSQNQIKPEKDEDNQEAIDLNLKSDIAPIKFTQDLDMDEETQEGEIISFSLDEKKEVQEDKEEDSDVIVIKNVLVAEDNDINQKLISKILGSFGLDVVIVPNGLMAVQKRQSEDFDMIFMDIAMPIMDGVEAIKNILKFEKENNRPHVPIVALTANALLGDRERFMKEGADEYITKPVKRANISEILDMFSSKSSVEQIYKERALERGSDDTQNSSEEKKANGETSEAIKLENNDGEEIKSTLKVEIVKKQKTLPHMDIMVFRKNSMETFVAKGIIQQTNDSCDSCESLVELCDKLLNTHYSLIIFDYEVPDLDIVKLSKCVNEAQKIHQKGDISTVMLAAETSEIPAKTSSLFTQVIKGVVGRDRILGLLDKYVGNVGNF